MMGLFLSSSFWEESEAVPGLVTTSHLSSVTGWPMTRLKGLKSAVHSQNSSGPGRAEDRQASRLQVSRNREGWKESRINK